MKHYTKEYVEDLLYIITKNGECEDIPCYPEDCPIYNECMYHSNKKERLKFAKNKI